VAYLQDRRTRCGAFDQIARLSLIKAGAGERVVPVLACTLLATSQEGSEWQLRLLWRASGAVVYQSNLTVVRLKESEQTMPETALPLTPIAVNVEEYG
jgi:hypothetical protein